MNPKDKTTNNINRTEPRDSRNPTFFPVVVEIAWISKDKPITIMIKKKQQSSGAELIIPKKPNNIKKNPIKAIKPRLSSLGFLTAISVFFPLESLFLLRAAETRSFFSTVGFDDGPGFFDWGSVISELSIKIDSGLDLDTMLSLCLRQKPDTRNSSLLQPSFAHFL